MAKNKIVVEVTYKFRIEYEHKDHLASIKKELKVRPINGIFGAGVASDGYVYGYSCKLLKGSVKK